MCKKLLIVMEQVDNMPEKADISKNRGFGKLKEIITIEKIIVQKCNKFLGPNGF